jgi:hypothetical protein
MELPKMPMEVVAAIIGLIGVVIGVIPTYFFMRQRSLAEVDKLRAETDKTKAEAEKIRSELSKVETRVVDNNKSFIILDDRSGFTIPLEIKLKNAQEICFLGVSLKGIVSHHVDYLFSKAKEGCKIRFLFVDPVSPATNSVPELPADSSIDEVIASRRKDIEIVVGWLKPIVKTGNAEIRLTNIVPPYALTMIDPATDHGEIQVGMYVYKAISGASERPHFTITMSNSEKWYRFFKNQYEKIWIDAKRND